MTASDWQDKPGACRQVGLDLWDLYCTRCGRHVNSYHARTKPHPDLCRTCYDRALGDGTLPLLPEAQP